MNLIQIFAIVNLLLSFGVPQSTADNVQAILMQSIAVSSPARIESTRKEDPPVIESASAPVIETPAPTLAELPVSINTATLNRAISRLYTDGAMRGVVALTLQGLVVQGNTDISADPFVEYAIDDVRVDPAAIDTMRFANGHHRLFVSAGGEKQSVDVVIKN